ncbi:MAG: hypothetical protein IJT50_02810 [Lentisphaeria bacterium]|nr:hypothetical protein [Lentisphaeria bacterium]
MKKALKIKVIVFACTATFVLLWAAAEHVRVQTFFHLKTGRLETRWRLGNFRLWSKTRESFSNEFFEAISHRMPDARLKIGDHPLFSNVCGGNAGKCPAELKKLFYLSKLEKYPPEKTVESAREIVSKYRKYFVKGEI